MGTELSKYWGPAGIILAMAFGAIVFLFKLLVGLLTDSLKRSETKLSEIHDQRLKEMNDLHGQRIKEQEAHSKQVLELHQEHLRQNKGMFDELVSISKNQNKALWDNATAVSNLTEAIQELKSSNDDNTRALHDAIHKVVGPRNG